MVKVGIINYNTGNLASVANALSTINNISYDIVNDADSIFRYDKIILPGVGAFGMAIDYIRSNSIDSALYNFINSGRFVLGICLGMQLLFKQSYEFGIHKGLGIFDGDVVEFANRPLKVPHMGWNKIHIQRDSKLLSGIADNEYLYFVHSFYVDANDCKDVIATSIYGNSFISIVERDNIFGIQPHPEKSSAVGIKILDNFIKI